MRQTTVCSAKLLLLFLADKLVVRAFVPPLHSVLQHKLSAAAAPNDGECSLDQNDVIECLIDEGYDQSSTLTIDKVLLADIEHLGDHFDSYRPHKDPDSLVILDSVRSPSLQPIARAFHQAGPRQSLHFDPSLVNAAIVTCGGLCPGLNNVIRELVHSLTINYGVQNVWGINGGFQGFNDPKEHPPLLLTNDSVENVHHEGGSFLKTSRGGFDVDNILEVLHDKQISQLYVIGGDGTHRAAYKIHQECQERNLNIAVAGIPKTIDNDIAFLDKSFGFSSAVEAAQVSIRSAKVEASCTIPNAFAVVKLMGRSAGFLAAFAALGSGDVDAVLIPEVPIVLEGPNGILPFIRKRVKEKKFAVVVVAEGAGEELLGESAEKDRGGNKKLPKIGEFIRDQIEQHFEKHGEETYAKYIDPSYTVRSVPANAADSLYCMQLAQNAVYGAMAGLTGFSVGLVNNRLVYLPIPLLVASSPRTMNPNDAIWQGVVALTGQPNTAQPAKVVQTDEMGLTLPQPTLH